MEKDPSYWPYEFIGVPLGINIFEIQKLSKKKLSVLPPVWVKNPNPKLIFEKHAPNMHFTMNTHQTWHIHIS